MADLLKAAEEVYAGLNARIDAAIERGEPIPVFDGIAALHSAIHSERRRRKRARLVATAPASPEMGAPTPTTDG